MAEPKKKRMSIWGKLGLGCGGLIVLIIIIAVVAGGGKSTTKNTATETKKEYAVGETINLNDHQLVVNSIEANYQSGNEFEKPQDPNNSFVVVDVNITNTGSKNLLVNEFGFKLEDETGTQRNTTFISGVDGTLQSVTLSPNGKTSGKLAFEAKKDSSKLILHYAGNGLLGNEITVKLK